MQAWKERFIREMELRGLAESTKKAYLRNVSKLNDFYDKSPGDINLEEVKKYLNHFQNENGRNNKKRSANSVNNAVSALCFLYKEVFSRNYYGVLPRQRVPQVAPTILTRDEMNLMIDSIHSVFYKAVLMTLYTTGMRQSELRNLKTSDIDSNRMVIYIRNAKGAKDRQALLSPTLLKCLRTYWRLFRLSAVKSDYLFIPNKNSYNGELKKKLSHTAVSYIVKKSAEVAGVKKKFTLIF